MSKISEYISKQFGNPHGVVGKIICLGMNVINKSMYSGMVSLVDAPADSKILDIGYGNGYLLKKLDRLGRNYDLYGIDISNDMLIEAEKVNSRAKKAGRLHLDVGDCCNMSFQDNMFNAVTSINTIYFWDDTVKGLSEIHRTLKENGKFYNIVYTKEWLNTISYTNTNYKKFERDEFIEMGNQAGFSDISIQDIAKNKSFAVIYTK